MRKHSMADSFSLEVRKLFLRYALLPVFCAYVILSALILFSYGFSIKYTTDKVCTIASDKFSQVISAYKNELTSITKNEQLEAIISRKFYSNEFVESIYRFVNHQSVGSHFFILDSSGELVLGSSVVLSDYLTNDQKFSSDSMSAMKNNPYSVSVSVNRVGNARTYTKVLSIGKAVESDGSIIGYFIFEINPQELLEYVSPGDIGEIIITNNYYTTLVSSNEVSLDEYSKLSSIYRNKNGFMLSKPEKIYLSSNYVTELNVWVITIARMGISSKIILLTIIISLLILVVSILLIGKRGSRIVSDEASSIDSLINKINRMKQEGLYTSFDSVGSHFNALEDSYCQLLDNIRDLAELNRQEVLMREQAEIKQLESQFNPHFIFNTLEIIRCLIKTDPKTAGKMIIDFSNILRYSLDATHEFTSLEEDLKHIEAYLFMNSKSHPDTITYKINMPESLKQEAVPKLCIQPIIENSLKYRDKRKKLEVVVNIEQLKGNQVEITVLDNGPGIKQELLEEINTKINGLEMPDKFFGLYNVNRRLKLIYGSSVGLSITSNNRGTRVTIIIPMVKQCL